MQTQAELATGCWPPWIEQECVSRRMGKKRGKKPGPRSGPGLLKHSVELCAGRLGSSDHISRLLACSACHVRTHHGSTSLASVQQPEQKVGRPGYTLASRNQSRFTGKAGVMGGCPAMPSPHGRVQVPGHGRMACDSISCLLLARYSKRLILRAVMKSAIGGYL